MRLPITWSADLSASCRRPLALDIHFRINLERHAATLRCDDKRDSERVVAWRQSLEARSQTPPPLGHGICRGAEDVIFNANTAGKAVGVATELRAGEAGAQARGIIHWIAATVAAPAIRLLEIHLDPLKVSRYAIAGGIEHVN